MTSDCLLQELGADVAINYNTQCFRDVVKERTSNKKSASGIPVIGNTQPWGVDIILDLVRLGNCRYQLAQCFFLMAFKKPTLALSILRNYQHGRLQIRPGEGAAVALSAFTGGGGG